MRMRANISFVLSIRDHRDALSAFIYCTTLPI